MTERVVSFNSERAPKRVSFTMAALREMFSRAEARVDFSVVGARASAIEAETTSAVAKLAAKATKRIIDRVPELMTTYIDSIGNLKLDVVDVGKIKAAYRDMLDRAWSTGLSQAMSETQKVRKRVYTHDERKLKFSSLANNAALYFESNAFRMAGDLTERMRSVIQNELLQGVKNGKRHEQVAADIYEALIRKGMTTLEEVGFVEDRDTLKSMVEDALLDVLPTVNVPAYLNTLARTNTYMAMNEARFAEFTDPSVSDFVVALRYSAILDDRTTAICEQLHGATYLPGNPLWEVYRPPNHYNCRSLLVAVTTLDGWDGVEDDAPSVEPQDGFK